jgi:hypothetical protein
MNKLASLLEQNLNKKIAVFFHVDDLAAFAHHHLADKSVYTTLLTTKLAPSIRTASHFFFKNEKNGILITTPMLEETIADDLDMIINVGQPESPESVTARNSRLKDNSVMITFLNEHLDAGLKDLPNHQELQISPKELQLNKLHEDRLFEAYEGLMHKLSSRIESKEDVFKAASSLLSAFSVVPRKTSIKFAEKVGMKDVLRSKNLLSAERFKQPITEKDVQQRQTTRIKVADTDRRRRREAKTKDDPEELKKRLVEIEKEAKKVHEKVARDTREHHVTV